MFEGDFEAQLPQVTQHIICNDHDEENLSTALMLRAVLLKWVGCNSPIMVRMQQSSGHAQLLEPNIGDPEIPDGLYPFGMLDHVLHTDNILANQLDELARSLHEMYVRDEIAANHVSNTENWNKLPLWIQKQNLLEADHWPVRLRAVRCISKGKAGVCPIFTEDKAKLQAVMEHNRYVTQKMYDCWTYGETKIAEAKVSPFLLPWDKLTGAQQSREIHDVHAQSGYFSEESHLSFRRVLTIGITGHRLDRVDVHDVALRERVRKALHAIGDKYADHHFVIMSPLAEGADRLVAELAMDILKASLQVPLPLPYDLYVGGFSSDDSIEEFQRLVGKASYYYEMPMKFANTHELALGENHQYSEARNKQYALVGAYIVQRSDQLIAIYDGEPLLTSFIR